MFKFLLGCSIDLFMHMYAALILSCFWEWFAVPLGAIHIQYFHVLGFICTLAIITQKASLYVDDREMSIGNYVSEKLLGYTLTFAIGYYAHSMMDTVSL